MPHPWVGVKGSVLLVIVLLIVVVVAGPAPTGRGPHATPPFLQPACLLVCVSLLLGATLGALWALLACLLACVCVGGLYETGIRWHQHVCPHMSRQVPMAHTPATAPPAANTTHCTAAAQVQDTHDSLERPRPPPPENNVMRAHIQPAATSICGCAHARARVRWIAARCGVTPPPRA